MASDFLPKSEGNLVAFLENFNSRIFANQNSYSLTSADANALHTLTLQFTEAYTIANTAATRTASNIAIKDNTKANVVARVRQLAGAIQSNPIITDSQKLDLQLLVRKTTRTPVPAPTSSPMLGFIGATPGQATLRFADQNSPARRAKPAGVRALVLWYQIGGVMPVNVTGMTFAGNFTKNPIGLYLPDAASGQTVYYLAKWTTQSGLFGPLSTVLTAKAI